MAVRFDIIELSSTGHHAYPFISGVNNAQYLNIQTQHAYVHIGANNSSYAHFYTNAPSYYFNQPVRFDGNIQGYGGDETATFATYYDSNDTSYYIDLASTSTGLKTAGEAEVKSLRLGNGFVLAQGGSTYAQLGSWIDVNLIGLYSSNANGNGAHFYPNTSATYGSWRINGARSGWNGIAFAGTSSTFNTLMSQSNGAVMGLFNDTEDEWYIRCVRNGTAELYYNGGLQAQTDNGFFLANNQMRSPIFYDSADTNYYLDPANATTSLYANGKVYINGGHSTGRLHINYQHGSTPATDNNSSALTAWVSEPGITYNGAGIGVNINVSGQYYGRAYDTQYGAYVRFDKSNGAIEGWTTQGNAGTAGGQGTKRWHSDNNGNFYGVTSLRAPIFYDSDDSNYYINPASSTTSFVTKGDWRVPSGIAWSGEYTGGGKIQHHSNHWYIQSPDAGGVIFRNASANNRFTFDHTTAIGFASGSWRAPAFYDSGNTAYYLDPSSSTSLNVVGTISSAAKGHVLGANNATAQTAVLEIKSKSGAEQLRLTDGDSLGTSWGPFISFYDGGGTRRGYVQGAGTSSTAMNMRVVSQYGSFSVYTDGSGGLNERFLVGSNGSGIFRGDFTGESYIKALATYQITVDAVHGGGPVIEFGSTSDYDLYGHIGQQGGEYQYGTHSRDFAWYQGSTRIMELDYGGSNQEPVLAIGWNVAADNTKGTLQVFGHNNTDGTVRLGPHSSKGSTFSHIHYGSNGDWYIRPANNSGSVFVLNYSAISDERLKENIVDSEYGLSEITSLRPRNFNWIGSSTDDVHTGFVAQEVEAVVSKWITQGELDDHKSVDYNAITATLVKAVQELKAENEDLLNRVKALENK